MPPVAFPSVAATSIPTKVPPGSPTVANTGTTSATAPTVATTGVAGTTVAGVTASPSAGASVETPRSRAAINGFGDSGTMPKVTIALTPPPTQTGITEAKPLVDGEGWAIRGFIDVKYQPAVGGVNIDVETRHSRPEELEGYNGDDMAYLLEARVLDGSKERFITLSTLFDGIANPDLKATSRQRFFVNYDDINRWLQERTPNLRFTPGDPLAVHAVWKGVGHQWGGFCRGGYFESPNPLGKQSAVDIRAGGITVAAPAVQSAEFTDKPIDITLKMPEPLVTAFDLVLDKDAKLVSRREHEQKFSPRSLDHLREVTKHLLDICTGPEHEREEWLLQVFGKDPTLSEAAGYDVSGWRIHTTDRYYVKDEQGRVQVDAHGLPLIVPMVDEYQDNPVRRTVTVSSYDAWADDDEEEVVEPFPIARANAAARFRDGEIKAGESVGTMGKLNVKTARLTDPFTLTQTGLEVSLDTRYGLARDPQALKQLAKLLDNATSPYSPLEQARKSAPQMQGEDVTKVAVVNVANRYKFTLEHVNGMELEVSLDFVHAGIACKSAQPSQTQGMTEEQKFDHYARLFDANDSTLLVRSGHARKTGAEERNQVVFADGGNLVMAQLWTDAEGHKRVSEHPCQRFPQVEIEMDHVQARTVGPVQSAFTAPASSWFLTNNKDQDEFLKNVSSTASMNGPPVIHTFDDLKNPLLYQTQDYQEMQSAVTAFREGVFPEGVKSARQKAAMALELAGLIPPEALEVSAEIPGSLCNGDIKVSYCRDPNTICLMGTHVDSGAMDVHVDWNGFPIRVHLCGGETLEEVAEKVRACLDQAVLFKADMEARKDSFGRDVLAIVVTPREQGAAE